MKDIWVLEIKINDDENIPFNLHMDLLDRTVRTNTHSLITGNHKNCWQIVAYAEERDELEKEASFWRQLLEKQYAP